jgi:hypothetical protein
LKKIHHHWLNDGVAQGPEFKPQYYKKKKKKKKSRGLGVGWLIN